MRRLCLLRGAMLFVGTWARFVAEMAVHRIPWFPIGAMIGGVFQVVINTNALVAALRSRRGASFHLLRTLGDARWQPNLSTALIFEYEEVMRRESLNLGLPFDPDDAFLLELAVRCSADFLITYNLRDLAPAIDFGIRAVTPGEFLRTIEAEAL